MQELAVVGLGLIGSAALRHGAGRASVTGIGPAEPADRADHRGPFASHYDSGRVTRRIDAKRHWAVLASRAIEQYPIIEQQSGRPFHRDSGALFVRSDHDGVERLTTVAADVGIPITAGPVVEVAADLPFLNLPAHFTGVREGSPAGAIDPRAMIEAQLGAAEGQGALVARDTVMSIRPALSGFELLTVTGRTHQARRVLVAAGAYTADLLGLDAAVAVRPEVVVMGRVDEREVGRLSDMPSVLYLLDHELLDDVYVVPPARYPDGRWYVKIGGSSRGVTNLADPAAMNRSMQVVPDDERTAALREVLVNLLPEVEFDDWLATPCLITDTASGLPYIDRLDSGITVAFGGNGHAAKSADAIGALAVALAFDGAWADDELVAEDFSLGIGSYTPPTGSRHGT